MPKRTRSHQLEDESWKALDSSIPSNWVLRKPSSDYGIDGEIEIFDESGMSTGLLFFVQLKGTDIVDQKKALEHRFYLDTIGYYRSLQIPVLLIKYHSPSKKLFYRWVYEIDPYYTRKGSKSIKVVFPKKNRWSIDKASDIVTQIIIFRKLISPKVPLPIEFHVLFLGEESFNTPKGLISSMIVDAAKPLSDIIVFNFNTPNLLVPKIIISDDLISVDLACITSFNLHHPSDLYSKEDNIKYLPHDIIVGVAMALNRLGHSNVAAELAYNHILSSGLLDNYKAIFEVVSCFTLGRRVDMALKVAEKLLETAEDKNLYLVFSLPAFQKIEMTDNELEAFKKLLLRAINKSKELKFFKQTGSCHYNLGNRLWGGSWENDREAFYHYRMAQKFDPYYKNREYFWRELAGILFNLKKYSCSERFYKEAISLGANLEVLALRADALMFAGQYKAALDLFKEYEKNVEEIEPEWALKSWFLKGLIKTLGKDNQIRKVNEAKTIAAISKSPPKEAKSKIDKAINLDGLCSLAWFNQAVNQIAEKNYDDAFTSFLITGIVQPNDVEAWSNTILCIFNGTEGLNMLPSIFSVAYRINGEELIKNFAKKIEEQSQIPKAEKAKIINLIADYTRKFEKNRKEKPVLRWIEPDGTYTVVDPNIVNLNEKMT